MAPRSSRKGTKNYNLAYTSTTQIARSLELREVLEAFERALHSLVAQTAVDHTFVHAAVVGWHGRAIIIPGPTMSGKSTLSRALVAAGATFYSDEFAAVTAEGRVRPYLRALSLRSEDGSTQRIAPSMMGSAKAPPALPVGAVVLTKYEKKAAAYRPHNVPSGEAAFELFRNTITVRAEPARDLAALAKVAAGARALKGIRGEATEAAATLLGRL